MTDSAAIARLQSCVRGRVVVPQDPDYDRVRMVFNAAIDRRPRLLVQCADVADVMASVEFARSEGLLLAVRSGGHNGGGLGVCDDGLVIDLSRMKSVRVDAQARTARVEAGCTWGDVDHATHAFGLATPSGIISTTGVGGLTLGGGIGHLTRRFGLTIDSLLEADLVLADGRTVRASAHENPDLHWAIRGGGGNFGVVTSFLFRLHPLRTVVAGPTLWPLEQAAEVLQWYRRFIVQAPPELNGFFAFMAVPPGPPFPEPLHGRRMCAVMWCWTGPPDEAERALEEPQAFGRPVLSAIAPMPYPSLQSVFDALYRPGHQWHWRGDFVTELGDEAIARHAEHGHVPTPLSTMHLYPIDGAAHAADRHDTAFSYREANWAQVIVGVDPDPRRRPEITEWVRRYHDALHPFSAGGAYVNFMMDEGQERVRASYRDNFERLATIKSTVDPHNMFRVNQNIRPRTAAS